MPKRRTTDRMEFRVFLVSVASRSTLGPGRRALRRGLEPWQTQPLDRLNKL